ncbi:MAG: TRAP transporter small permease [Rhodospirillales bacterium]|nr:TRAP transporter small permease [Rhodospirillales bacterium]
MRRLRNIYKILTIAGLIAIVFVPNLQIGMRALFDAPVNGADELARYLLIVITFLALPLAVVDGGHIAMEEFQVLFPAGFRRYLRLVIKAAAVLGYGFVAVAAVVTMLENLENTTSTLSIPFYIFIAPVVLGMTFMAIEYLLAMRKEFTAGRD